MRDLRLEWRQAAHDDLLAIVGHVADDSPDAAQKLKDDIEAKVGKLVDYPRLYKPGRMSGTREMPVRRSYIVVYAEDGGRITVLRILHAAQLWPR